MPLHKQVLEKHLARSFIETGTHRGDACRLAVRLGFKRVLSCDVTWYDFDEEGVQRHIMESDDFLLTLLGWGESDVTFWLDAHGNGPALSLFDLENNPLAGELIQIHRKRPCRSTILIDDLRLYSDYERGLLLHMLAGLWPDGVISFEDGCVPEDILCLKI